MPFVSFSPDEKIWYQISLNPNLGWLFFRRNLSNKKSPNPNPQQIIYSLPPPKKKNATKIQTLGVAPLVTCPRMLINPEINSSTFKSPPESASKMSNNCVPRWKTTRMKRFAGVFGCEMLFLVAKIPKIDELVKHWFKVYQFWHKYISLHKNFPREFLEIPFKHPTDHLTSH